MSDRFIRAKQLGTQFQPNTYSDGGFGVDGAHLKMS